MHCGGPLGVGDKKNNIFLGVLFLVVCVARSLLMHTSRYAGCGQWRDSPHHFAQFLLVQPCVVIDQARPASEELSRVTTYHYYPSVLEMIVVSVPRFAASNVCLFACLYSYSAAPYSLRFLLLRARVHVLDMLRTTMLLQMFFFFSVGMVW